MQSEMIHYLVIVLHMLISKRRGRTKEEGRERGNGGEVEWR